MSSFDFVSHEEFPEDKYVKECVYICIEGKHRVGYVRKITQNGGMFWDVINTSVTKNGARVFLKAYTSDSNFLKEDIMHFLENRGWEKLVRQPPASQKVASVQENDQLPF